MNFTSGPLTGRPCPATRTHAGRFSGPSARALPVLACLSAVTLGGCGYSAGDASSAAGAGAGGFEWSSVYRDDVRTIAVPPLRTQSFRRGDEIRLTKALVQQIEARTPYKVVPAERADSILEAQLVSSRIGTLSEDRLTALPQEQAYVLTVDFVWRDLRGGRVLAERRGFEQSTTFYPTLGEGTFAGSQASIERLAAAIVEQLRPDW